MACCASDASPYDDLRLEYFNPHTGGPVMPTIACYAQKLRAGVHTQKHRHNNATIYHVFRGSGYTMIEDQRFDWSERDVFVIPGWHWHEHVNLSASADAVLISYTDEPLLQHAGDTPRREVPRQKRHDHATTSKFYTGHRWPL